MRAQEQQMQQLAAQQQALGASSRGMGFDRSPSPVRIQPFSNGAIVQLAEKIKSEENFASTLPASISYLYIMVTFTISNVECWSISFIFLLFIPDFDSVAGTRRMF